MILDFEKEIIPPDREFDVCIVGAGAAGLVLAHELTGRGCDVLLLEGGGRSRWERRSQALNKSLVRGHPFAGAHSGRFRGLGGSTTAWAGQVMELDDLDFEPRDWVEGSAWPIGKADLKPFYARARRLEGIGDQVNGDDAASEMAGRDLGDELKLSFSEYCPERKFVRLFADTIASPRLTVLLHANVVEMTPSADSRRIEALRFRTLGGKEGSVTARNVVLCLGGIESARLLLNQPFAPWNQSGLVGRHFQDHVHCFVGDIRGADPQAPGWVYGPARIGGKYLPKLKLSADAQKRRRVLNVSGMIEYADGVYPALRTAVKILAGPISAIEPAELIRMVPLAPGAAWHHFQTKKNPDYQLPWAKPKLSVYCEQSPLSESRITLSSKRDKLGLRRAAVDWRISQLEIDTIRTYATLARDAFSAHGIGEIVLDPDLFSDRITQRCTDQFHHCGGTRMAVSPRDGVVDTELRLHGLENAYVCSSSVFPCSGFTNPTHTIIALAIRLGDRLSASVSAHGQAV